MINEAQILRINERERVLVAEVAKLQDLIRLRLIDDKFFLDNHPEEETIFLREWTDDAQKALTPEPSPEAETCATCGGSGFVGPNVAFPQECPTCQPVQERDNHDN